MPEWEQLGKTRNWLVKIAFLFLSDRYPLAFTWNPLRKCWIQYDKIKHSLIELPYTTLNLCLRSSDDIPPFPTVDIESPTQQQLVHTDNGNRLAVLKGTMTNQLGCGPRSTKFRIFEPHVRHCPVQGTRHELLAIRTPASKQELIHVYTKTRGSCVTVQVDGIPIADFFVRSCTTDRK